MKKLCRRMEGELLGFDAQKQFVFFLAPEKQKAL